MNTRRPTIADVARAAGVSPSTASVVFSGKTRVSDATRRRVLDAAATLGYTGPDPLAASLRRGRSGVIGVVFQGPLRTVFLDPVTRIMMDGIAEGVAPLGAGLLLLRDDEDREGGLTLTTAPLDAAVLVGCSARTLQSLEILRARSIPTVVIEGDAGEGVPQIGLDNREAQRQMARHVAGLGHRKVATLTLPYDTSRSRGPIDPAATIVVDVTRDRLAGFRDVYPDAPAYAGADSSIDEGLAAGRVLLAGPATRPTAVVAQSDLLAVGVIRAAEEAGLRVPKDVTVTGFDGVPVDGLAPYELTTMVQPAAGKGRAAGDAVTAMLRGDEVNPPRFTSVFRAGNTSAPPIGWEDTP